MDGWMERWMMKKEAKGLVGSKTTKNGKMDGWMDRQIDVYMHKWMERCVDG